MKSLSLIDNFYQIILYKYIVVIEEIRMQMQIETSSTTQNCYLPQSFHFAQAVSVMILKYDLKQSNSHFL